ncbi:MAG: hypothetical protein AUK53_06055 [Betaproteobacteria bacterium CG2_30_59_46]|nr:MAG: hypothetical protein AUK53_06055 [Betaproteobacteria bacterium CG2_30_59_46]PIQ11152.1 MAG: hypothetical protein COW70_12570 [Hydrogenophilales bacterium CG18_big_fil_WC_8_21_14_2_50_58_12]PIY01161.1 MAG: hypothetical protein COZ23_04685 [Hydrogenophilales bacterium CG_4_10_14_3_um_filter_58_23]PJB05822.1 MAG: hypothetical protein CO125_08275 [Hydrogenophilales bacterium CG_4_9_14_3_um_filter_59_35]
MNEPTNEYGLAKKIVHHLDYGTANLDSRIQYRLQAARQHALEAYAEPRHSFSLAWAGHGHSSHRAHSPFRAWVPLALLVLGLMFATYWQNTQEVNDVSEIDAHLLAQDLPIHAFIDNGFDTWLEGSSQE